MPGTSMPAWKHLPEVDRRSLVLYLKTLGKKFKTQKISIMPGNFKDILTLEETRNLLAFLETLKIFRARETKSEDASAIKK